MSSTQLVILYQDKVFQETVSLLDNGIVICSFKNSDDIHANNINQEQLLLKCNTDIETVSFSE